MLYESNYYGTVSLGDTLTHHGIKGQKWGIRRFQNPDGTLTALGKQRYGTVENFNRSQQRKKEINKNIVGASRIGGGIGVIAGHYITSRRSDNHTIRNAIASYAVGAAGGAAVGAALSMRNNKKKLSAKELKQRKEQRKEMAKKIAKGVAIGAAVAGTAYIAHKKIKEINEQYAIKNTLDVLNNLARSQAEQDTLNRINAGIKFDPIKASTFNGGSKTVDRIMRESLDSLKRKNKTLFNASTASILDGLPRGNDLSEMTMDDLRKLDLY